MTIGSFRKAPETCWWRPIPWFDDACAAANKGWGTGIHVRVSGALRKLSIMTTNASILKWTKTNSDRWLNDFWTNVRACRMYLDFAIFFNSFRVRCANSSMCDGPLTNRYLPGDEYITFALHVPSVLAAYRLNVFDFVIIWMRSAYVCSIRQYVTTPFRRNWGGRMTRNLLGLSRGTFFFFWHMFDESGPRAYDRILNSQPVYLQPAIA